MIKITLKYRWNFLCLILFFSQSLVAQRGTLTKSAGQKMKDFGDAYYFKSDFKNAEKYYLFANKYFNISKDYKNIATVLSNLASIDYMNGNVDGAIAKCKRGVSIINKYPNDTVSFRLYSMIGDYYDVIYRNDSADYFFSKAETLLERSKLVESRQEVLYFYSNQGVVAINNGDYKKADFFLQKAISISKRDPNFDLGSLYNNVATNFYIQNNFVEAKRYFLYSLTQKNTSANFTTIMLNLAGCNIQLKEFKVAYQNIQKAYQAYKKEKLENPLVLQNYYLTLGIYHKEVGNFQLASENYRKSLAINQKLNLKGSAVGKVYLRLGQLSDVQNQPEQAIGFYQKALVATHQTFSSKNIYQNPPLDNILNVRELFKALVGKSNALKKYYQITKNRIYLESALQTYQIAIALADKMRRSYQSTSAKLFFTEKFYDVYEQSIEVAQNLYELTLDSQYQKILYEIYEKSRSTALLDVIREANLKPKTIPERLLNQEKTLYQQIAGLQVAIKQSDSVHAVKLKEKLTDKEIQLINLTKRFEKTYPAYYKLKYDSFIPSISKIRQDFIDTETAVIQYFVGQNQLYILLITDRIQKTYRIPIDSTFNRNIISFRNMLKSSPIGETYSGEAISTAIYSILIAPIENDIKLKRRLIIIRDAQLNYLPFEVLAKTKNEYLLRKYIISYAFSTTLLSSLPPKNTSNETGFRHSFISFAPFSQNTFQRSIFRDKNLGQLPKSRDEVEKIGGDIYLENNATKKRFYEKYRNKSIIHFATHAVTDDSDPLKSFIAFYPESVDFKLFTNELYDLDLRNTNLVMLSACETGIGKLRKGEGLMSLARAFSYAGARAVITTLWNAHDEASAFISARFHEHLQNGLKTDEALQKAKLDFFNSELSLRYNHPYYWANFILIGPAETIDFGTNWWVWVFSIIFLLFLIFMVTKLRGKSISPKKAETRIG